MHIFLCIDPTVKLSISKFYGVAIEHIQQSFRDAFFAIINFDLVDCWRLHL